MPASEARFRRLLSRVNKVASYADAEIVAQDLYELAYNIREQVHEWDSVLVTEAETNPYTDIFEKYFKIYRNYDLSNKGIDFNTFMKMTSIELNSLLKVLNNDEEQ